MNPIEDYCWHNNFEILRIECPEEDVQCTLPENEDFKDKILASYIIEESPESEIILSLNPIELVQK